MRVFPLAPLLLGLGCRTLAGPGEEGDAPLDSGADGADDTGEVLPNDDEEPTPSCEHEVPPTAFTGGLVLLASLAPDGGAYAFDYEGAVTTREEGTIDWGAGTWSAEVDYIDGYATLSATESGTFTWQEQGDYTLASSRVTTQLDGSATTRALNLIKEGCTWVSSYEDDDNGTTTTETAVLVDPSTFEFNAVAVDAETQQITFEAAGTRTDDWTTTYTFWSDLLSTAVSPEREGTCTSWGDGTMECVMVLYLEDGTTQDATNFWYTDGSWTRDWSWDDPDTTWAPDTWGHETGTYWGAGTHEWYQQREDGVVTCNGTWDEDGVGSWSCSDGSGGTYGG